MKSWIFSISLLWISIFATAQDNDQQLFMRLVNFMEQKRWKDAEATLNVALQNSPSSPVLQMMKGNLLLNYAWVNSTESYLDIDRAESIFDTTAASLQLIPVIQLDTSKLVEGYFRKAWNTDSLQVEYLKGICNLYSVSLRTEDLKKEMVHLFEKVKYQEGAAYRLTDYARNVIQRGQFERGMEIYKLVATLFPDEAGIRADIAGEYFQHGFAQKALEYADSAMRFKNIDEISYVNVAAIYSTLTYYDDALKYYRAFSKKYKTPMDLFYRGLMLYAEGNHACKDSMIRFLSVANADQFANEWPIAEYIKDSGNVCNNESMMALTSNQNATYYSVPVLQRGMRSTDKEIACQSSWNMAQIYLLLKQWNIAQNFVDGNECEPNYLTAAVFAGYVSYQLEQWQESEMHWMKVPDTQKSISDMKNYFLARIYDNSGKKEKAMEYRNKIAKDSSSKYSALAQVITWKL